ncbi:MAG: sugar phosphate isomerase/epimerase [Candidatus Methanomethyliaceae archaeon]|nr:sugar phosphate isomerase/epimerase [Candidatus Methanomethyliaceae archaeon]MCX8170080.1 sugar phosphate isomerase/epimerase [Candidatus Methanomethyliaceae archaeon]MDW7971195.1 sugar phosphate isomerase/epimerase [Nitrososphaerota archaeon]
MPIGISTLCTVGKTFKVINELISLRIELLELLDEWKDKLTKNRIKTLNEIKNTSNIRYTVHAPILDLNIAASNDTIRNTSIKIIMNSMERARAIDAEVFVIHPGLRTPLENLVPNLNKHLNMESLRRILNYGENLGLKVAIENMPAGTRCFMQNSEEFSELIENGFSPYIVLDIGHANTSSQIKKFITELKDKIIHLHLHDNYGIEDEHRIIGDGNVDWNFIKSNISLDRIYAVVENTSLNDAIVSYERAIQLFKS